MPVSTYHKLWLQEIGEDGAAAYVFPSYSCGYLRQQHNVKGNGTINIHVFSFTHSWHYSLCASCVTAKTPNTLVCKKSTKCGSVKLLVIWNTQHLLNLFVGCHLGRLHNTAGEQLEKADALTATNSNLITLSITFTHHSRSPSQLLTDISCPCGILS